MGFEIIILQWGPSKCIANRHFNIVKGAKRFIGQILEING